MLNCPIKGKTRYIQPFGVNPELYPGYAGHMGIDLAGPVAGVSTKVYAPAAGRITIAGPYNGYGNCVRLVVFDGDIADTDSEITLGHFKTIDPSIRDGMNVKLGQYLGMSGKSGHANGIHVHLELRILDNKGNVLGYNNGYKGAIDPLPYMLMWEHNNDSPLFIRV